MAEQRHTFRRAQRLKDQMTFVRTTRTGARDVRGPLVFHIVPSATPTSRFGIRIGRRVGSAPIRNLIKRRLREAYRSSQHDHAATFDLVVTVRPHAPLSFVEYRRLLSLGLARLVRKLAEAAS